MSKHKRLPSLSEEQTEIMNVVWELSEITLAQVCTALVSRGLARNTVQTQIARLVENGRLLHCPKGKAFYYWATVPREEAQSRVVQRLAVAMFGGSAEGLVMSLLDGRKLSKEEADRIRILIEKSEDGKPLTSGISPILSKSLPS